MATLSSSIGKTNTMRGDKLRGPEFSGQHHQLKEEHMKSTKKEVRQMRRTASMVAVTILVQLTVAATSVRPGRYDWIDDTNTDKEMGNMARKAAFAVFLLAETVTFFNAMVAVIVLLWSTVGSDADKSMWLIKRSMLLLMPALCGTLVVFTTGVFVIYPMSFWATTGVPVLLTLVGFSALIFKAFSI